MRSEPNLARLYAPRRTVQAVSCSFQSWGWHVCSRGGDMDTYDVQLCMIHSKVSVKLQITDGHPSESPDTSSPPRCLRQSDEKFGQCTVTNVSPLCGLTSLHRELKSKPCVNLRCTPLARPSRELHANLRPASKLFVGNLTLGPKRHRGTRRSSSLLSVQLFT